MDKRLGFRLCTALCLAVVATGCSNSAEDAPATVQNVPKNLPNWAPSASQLADSGTTVDVSGSPVVIPNGLQLSSKVHNYPSLGVDVVWAGNTDRHSAWFDVEVDRGYETQLSDELNFELSNVQTFASSGWTSSAPEYGSINGYTCIRSYWKGNGSDKNFHGFEYVADAGSGANSAVMKITVRDYEPYSTSTIVAMDAAARRAIYLWKPTP